VPAPTGVAATSGEYTDYVLVTWTAVTGAASYSVYRGETSDAAQAVRIAENLTVAEYQDSGAVASAPPPGCFQPRVVTEYFYWVTAVSPCNESALAGPDQGHRAKMSAPEASASAGNLVVMAAGLLALLAWRRGRVK